MRHLGLLLLRLGMSIAMIYGHGYPKLMKAINGDMSFLDPLGFGQVPTLILAILSEVVFPILVIIGFKTRLATIPVALTMAVAFFVVHAHDPFNGNKELALLFLIGFTTVGLLGPGRYSIDRT